MKIMVNEFTKWRWAVGVENCNLNCDECGHSLGGEVGFFNNKRKLCLDCACLVLNIKEDYIEELESKKENTE